MKITFVTIQDSTNISSFSGTGYFVPKSLKNAGAEISYIGNLKKRPYLYIKFREYFSRIFFGKNYWLDRDPLVVKNFAKQIKKQLSKHNPDVLLSISSIPMAMLKTDIPIVFWTDAVLYDMIDFYPEYSKFSKSSTSNGNKIEKIALENCALALYSSHWAANGAVKHYNIPSEKVKVVNYGANLENVMDAESVLKRIERISSKTCKLLFVGVHWERKGGAIALDVAKCLKENGVDVELNILGVDVPSGIDLPEFVHTHGFVSKGTPEGKAKVEKLIDESHFLILPTRADCTPIVFAEFNSYGIPCLTTDVGGNSDLIKDGVNGKLFQLNDKAEIYADFIKEIFSNVATYKELAKSSRKEYEDRLNWEKTGTEAYGLLEQIVRGNK